MNRSQLVECWASLLQLLRDAAAMAPPLLFAALAVFGEAVQRYPTGSAEKRDQRDVQDVTTKLLDACATVAAACLEQTTWLRRNLSVRRDLAVSPPSRTHSSSSSLLHYPPPSFATVSFPFFSFLIRFIHICRSIHGFRT